MKRTTFRAYYTTTTYCDLFVVLLFIYLFIYLFIRFNLQFIKLTCERLDSNLMSVTSSENRPFSVEPIGNLSHIPSRTSRLGPIPARPGLCFI